MPVTSGYGTWAWRGFGGSAGDRERGGKKTRKTGEKEGREKHRNLSNHPKAPLAQSESPESRERGGKWD